MAKATNYNMMKRIEKLEEKAEDSGWINLTLESGVIAHNKGGSSQPQYKKIGNHVYIRGAVETNWDGENLRTIAVLPERLQDTKYSIFY